MHDQHLHLQKLPSLGKTNGVITLLKLGVSLQFLAHHSDLIVDIHQEAIGHILDSTSDIACQFCIVFLTRQGTVKLILSFCTHILLLQLLKHDREVPFTLLTITYYYLPGEQIIKLFAEVTKM